MSQRKTRRLMAWNAVCVLLLVFAGARTAHATFTILDNATGGDATVIGTWNPATKTATLTADVTQPIVIVDSGITLDCAGHSITGTGQARGVLVENLLQSVTVRNCVVSGFDYGIHLWNDNHDCLIEGNTVSNHQYRGIVAWGTPHGVIIRHNTVSFCREGIRIGGTTNTVEQNTVTDNGDHGIRLLTSDGAVIRGNTLLRNGLGAPGGGAGFCCDATNALIDGNVAHGNYEGFKIVGSGNTVRANTSSENAPAYGIHVRGSDNTVQYNTAHNGGSIGMFISDGANNIVRDNTATGNGSTGIAVARNDGSVVSGNVSTGNMNGFSVGGAINTVTGNIANGNADFGLTVGGSGNVLENNTANNNGDPALNNDTGIFVNGVNQIVRNNISRDNLGRGIWDGGGAVGADGNTFEGNTVIGNWEGIRITGTNAVVRGNTVSGSRRVDPELGYGVRLDNQDGQLEDNLIQNNEGHGIEVRAAVTNPGGHTITGNRVTDNAGFSMYAPAGSGMLIYNNLFDSAGTTLGVNGDNEWNAPQQAGPNIVGGPFIGGNFWGTTANDGYSETCTDANNDGFCDAPFEIRLPNNIDYLPLVIETDSDNDGIPDEDDNCPDDANMDQSDLDEDGLGDVCDDDADGDGDPVPGDCDDLDPSVYTGAVEICNDGIDNDCDMFIDVDDNDGDCDADGILNVVDNCPDDINPGQVDTDNDTEGDACDVDDDGDSVFDEVDNCPIVANIDQTDFDGDGAGDVCDDDGDGDGIVDFDDDLCHFTAQSDADAGVPNQRLGKNRWADVDGDGQFDTSGNNPTGRAFTMTDTAGCNCAQIIELCGYGNGHTKFGCSNSVMDTWTGLYDRDGEPTHHCE